MNKACKTVIAMVLACYAVAAAAEDYAGIVKTSRGSPSVERAGTQIVLAPGTRVQQGDRITTGSTGHNAFQITP